MRKILSKFCSLGLLILLLVTSLYGCGSAASEDKTDTGGTAQGRYLEEELSLPENITSVEAMGRLSDGSLELMAWTDDNTERRLFVSGDHGGTWEEKALPEGLGSQNCYYTYGAAISPSGQIFVTGGFGSDSESAVIENWIFDGEGQGKKLEIPLKNGGKKEDGSTDNFISEAAFTEDGGLYGMDIQQNIYQIDPDTGNLLDTLGTADDNSVFDTAGSYVFFRSDGQIHVMNRAPSEGADSVLPDSLFEENQDNIPGGDGKNMVFAGGGSEIYYADNQGIYHYNLGGSVSEQLVNGELNSLPNLGLKKLFQTDENTFLLWAADGSGEDVLLKYAYSAEAATVPDQELTVYALEDSSELRQAISAFQKENADTYVNLVIGKSGDDAVTTDDALRTLNSDIMAGEGPDVLILDGMPVDNYIEKGLLLDISDVVSEVKEKESLFENLCEVYKKDGSYYGVPSRFLIPFVQGDQDSLAAAGSLETLASHIRSLGQQGNQNPVISLSARTLLGFLFDVDSAGWIQGADVDEEKLKQFYESVKSIYDADSDKDQALDLEKQDLTDIGIVGSMDLFSGNIAVNMGTIGSDSDLSILVSVNDQVKDRNLSYDLVDGKESKVFLPVLSAGISSKSQHADAAKAFIQTLLSAETGSVSGRGLPVNQAAFEAVMQQGADVESDMALSGSDGEEISLTMQSLEQEDIRKLQDLISALDTAAVTDTVVRDQIIEQGEAYLTGGQSLEDTIQNAMQKITLYLSE